MVLGIARSWSNFLDQASDKIIYLFTKFLPYFISPQNIQRCFKKESQDSGSTVGTTGRSVGETDLLVC